MHPHKSIPEPWLSFLRELDSSLHEEVRLDCMGGFVVTMVYGFSRPTADLDVLEIAPTAAGRSMLELGRQGGPLHKEYKIYLDRVGVAKVPENYQDRLTEIFPGVFKHLRLLALDPYDRVVKAGTEHPTRPRRCEALGEDSSIRSRGAERPVSKGTALAASQSGARRSHSASLD